MNEQSEVFIQVRLSGISVSSPRIGDNPSKVIQLLETTLTALKDDDRKKEVFKNEIVIKQK